MKFNLDDILKRQGFSEATMGYKNKIFMGYKRGFVYIIVLPESLMICHAVSWLHQELRWTTIEYPQKNLNDYINYFNKI